MKKFLSVIIPLYNEQKRLHNLMHIYNYLSGKKFDWEIILVNDGSTDQTKKAVVKMLKSNNLKNTYLVSYIHNKGKGFAIKRGTLEACGEYRLFTDIDLSAPIEEFNKFIPYLKDYDIIIGSRRKRGSRLIIHQPKLREKLGKGFTKLSQVSLGLSLTDFTCGFKCFSKEAAEKIFSRQKIDRWGFDTEILFIGKKMGFSIKEVPVVWKNDRETKVRLPQDIINSLYDLIKIRYNKFRGLYD